MLRQRYQEALDELSGEALELLKAMAGAQSRGHAHERYSYTVRGREITGAQLSRVAEPPEDPEDRGAGPIETGASLLTFLMKENLPGAYPYTGGVYPVSPPRRGPDAHVRRRRHAGADQPPLPLPVAGPAEAARLSTAFDSVTLYGEDPHERPDIYGKVGNSGVSIATVDDMKKLYSGFDLCAIRRHRCR